MTKGEQLIAFRKKQGLSISQVVAKCQISPHTWSDYEKGLKNPRRDVVQKICSAFGITEEELFPSEDKKQVKVAEAGSRKEMAAEAEVKAKEQETASKDVIPAFPRMIIQSQKQEEVSLEDVIRKVKRVAPHAECIYIKPGENRAYWTARDEADWVWLW